jgi:Rps23 Pro-64 3,4-dihydroxylase Tpa1-like proline 4-hydroxylase
MSIINKNIHDLVMQTIPFPYGMQDNFLDSEFAYLVQQEILNITQDEWDRYENPFEQKYTLRNKYAFPFNLNKLFEELTKETFIEELSKLVGYELTLDTTRNFWGVHKYGEGDKLDIHVDAGLHPTLNLKKQITLGIYLSYEWKEEYGCHLEIWSGDNCAATNPKLIEKVDSISPLFNRLVIFTCNDYAWHGNPEPATCQENSKRIFITLSYLSKNFEDENKRVKAFFIARPNDPLDYEKDKLRLIRADPEKYKEIYRI